MTPPSTAGRIEAYAPIEHQEASHVGWAGIFAHRFTSCRCTNHIVWLINSLLCVERE